MNTKILLLAVLCASAAFAAPRKSSKKAAPPPVQTSAPAPAQPSAALTEEERPWARGVSESNRTQALELFRQGNLLLKDSVFVQAAAKYREALRQWDHPAIHYNLVLALVNLDQPVEVHQHLVKAMAYGPAPLDQDKFEQARAYKVLVEKQLAQVTITCEVPGATVKMDGRPLFTAPGKYEGMVRAGPHTIIASREGYMSNEVSRSLPPGETTVVELKLYTDSDLTQYRRKWSAWIPWSVVAGGAALAGGGGLLHMSARDGFSSFDQGIADCGGCVPTAVQNAQLSTANTMQNAAFVAYGVGGAALITGAVLVYVNRLEPYRINPNGTEVVDSVAVFPILTPNEGGVMATVRF